MTRMKDSGIKWIGEVPEEWGITKFKYFLDTNKGLTITKENLIEDGIPVINYGQIHSKYGKSVSTDRDELPQVSANYLKFEQSLLKPGDFVFADTSEDIDGSGNFSTRIDDNGELFAGYHTIKAKLKNALEHDFRYFMHYFDSLAFRKQVQNRVSGIKVYSITQSILQETCLILPSLYEQNQIADFLDKKVAQLDKVKSLLEEQIKTLEGYRQSLIYETVTKGLDKTVPLKDSGVDWIGQIPEGWNVDRLGFHIYEINEKNIPQKSDFILSLTNKDGVIPYEEKGNQGNNSKDNLLDYKLAYPDTIVANSMNILIGSVGYSNYFGCISPVYYVFKERKGTNLRFVNYIMATQLFQKELRKYANGILEIRLRVSSEDILKRFCAFPSLSDQDKIVSYLDKRTNQINQMIAIKKEQIENINKQRQTLIYDYVTGKRRV
ncbi:TPA: restriction endonuclease subunit S [Streptococcus suis]|nr:restriction endonuclease subunit S [Streptococcus suis]